MSWQLQEAKNRLSELVRECQRSGPQVITVHGKEIAVVLSIATFRKMSARKRDLVTFLRQSPWADVELDTERSTDTGRDVDL